MDFCTRYMTFSSVFLQLLAVKEGHLAEFQQFAVNIIMSPLCGQRWGHIALPLSAQSVWVCAVSLSHILSLQNFLSCRRSNTRRWLNAGIVLAHRLRRWSSISPVLGYRVEFGATLNVGQRHRRRANIDPALVQSIVPVLPACRY